MKNHCINNSLKNKNRIIDLDIIEKRQNLKENFFWLFGFINCVKLLFSAIVFLSFFVNFKNFSCYFVVVNI